MKKTALGISIGHDRGAAVIQNGTLIGAIAQERLDRIKHSSCSALPFESIDRLLSYLSIGIDEIDCIGFSGAELENDLYMKFLLQTFYDYYQCSEKTSYMISHHQSHAEAVFSASNFDEALILIADGGGDYTGNQAEAESLFIGKNSNVTLVNRRTQSPIIRHMSDTCNYLYPCMPDFIRNRQLSLSRKYEQITYLLGFGWGQAGKTMGLASYGKPLIQYNTPTNANFQYNIYSKDILEDLYSFELLSGKNHFEFIKENGPNIAQTIQTYTENTIISLINSLVKHYHQHNICLGGGLFLNCLLNHKILEKCSVDKLFVFPACGDDGQAIGNAFAAYKKHFGTTKFSVPIPYLGISYSDQEIESLLNGKNLSYTYHSDKELACKMAELIAENKIIGFHRGRTEIGPRALCHRSILANPANPQMKDILNNRVKHREYFRPFAPVVVAERQYDIFNLKQESPYMLLAAPVHEQYRDKIPAVTHIDHTARVQSVSHEQEPFIHAFLIQLEEKIGVPVVLNTSFNVAGEPIVESPNDAIQTFLKTDIDVLVIGNYIVSK